MSPPRTGLLALRSAPSPLAGRLFGLGAVALVILLWFAVTRGASAEQRLVSPVILPSPVEVFRSFGALWVERDLPASIIATLRRVLIGFGLAGAVGIPIGIVAGSWRIFESAGAP